MPNDAFGEALTYPDRFVWRTYATDEFATPSAELFGALPPDAHPAANTRLLHQVCSRTVQL